MIYLFGQGKNVSIIYAPETLTEQDKQGAIVVEALPPVEERDEYNAILCLDDTNKPYWEYMPIQKGTD